MEGKSEEERRTHTRAKKTRQEYSSRAGGGSSSAVVERATFRRSTANVDDHYDRRWLAVKKERRLWCAQPIDRSPRPLEE